jgi:Probable zinc-ribbon domain
MARRSDGYSDYVEHPRFGRGPRVTGLNPVDTVDGSVFCHWHSPPGVRVPDTAVAADVARQISATVPVTHYFDARRVCRKCERPFLFFAEEQRFWYEELGFPLAADALECVACRRDERQLRARKEKYEALLAAPARTESETLLLVECAVVLVESDVFATKVIPRLRGLLKPILAEPEGPNYAQAQALRLRIEAVSHS